MNKLAAAAAGTTLFVAGFVLGDAQNRPLDPWCQEDEVAAPRVWRPGLPVQGIVWECVNAETFSTEYMSDLAEARKDIK